MASAVRALLVERRYPFLITLALFLLSIFVLSSNPNPSAYLPFLRDLNFSQSLRSSFPISFSTAPNSTSIPYLNSDPGGGGGGGEIQNDGGGVGEIQNDGLGRSDGGGEIQGDGGDGDAIEDFEAKWAICPRGTGFKAPDYIPCLDNWKVIRKLKSRRHMEHRERHCPIPSPRCLIPLPPKYRLPLPWPKSRDMVWYDNVPYPKLAEYKKNQNWVQISGDYLIFPGGGTQFKDGVANYIQFIEQILPLVNWGRHTRVVLDVGCGVGSFGGHLLEKDVITMSFAPKDEHEAQIQFALERGIPAFLSVIGTQRLPFPDNVFDLIHCARCRVHWDADGGKPLLELNRILRPGGLFVWSATPVYRDDQRDRTVWKAMVDLVNSICWKTVVKSTDASGIGVVIYQKPSVTSCYEHRKKNKPPLCNKKNQPGISWYVPLDGCLPKIPLDNSEHEYHWPASWPERLKGVSSSLAEEPTWRNVKAKLNEDQNHWEKLVSEVYLHDLGIHWPSIRNVMDMNAGFGGFAAALVHEPLWVMNAVPIHGPNTLPIIFERGLAGMYHDWCEAFNTYPRTYDLLHSYFLFENLTTRCDIVDVMVEMDRVLRPGGWVVIQDTNETLKRVRSIIQSLHWFTTLYKHKILVGKKGFWRPQ